MDDFSFLLFDYVDSLGANKFSKWSRKLQKTQKAKLNEKLDLLQIKGTDLPDGLLTDSGVPGILKLRIKAGNVQLRPLLCKGPINNDTEFTLLLGAKEIGNCYCPDDAPNIAKANKDQIVSDQNRRVAHEKIL